MNAAAFIAYRAKKGGKGLACLLKENCVLFFSWVSTYIIKTNEWKLASRRESKFSLSDLTALAWERIVPPISLPRSL
jgi:hypothetical protein